MNTENQWPGRLGELLGLDHPIVQGPFGGGLSSVALLAAVANGGGLGGFGAHHLEPGAITDLVRQAKAATARSFAINLWVPHPAEQVPVPPELLWSHVRRLQPYYDALGISAPNISAFPEWPDFDEQLAAAMGACPPVLSFVMGIPHRDAITEARRRGIVTIGTATTVEEAVAVEAAGLDAVVASGSDAGGHRGSFLRPVRESLVGTFSLIPQVADAVTIPVIAAGGIADARGVAAALLLGADAVQIGTGFLATAESGAGDVHKAALHEPTARTTVLTRLFTGRHARAIMNPFISDLTRSEPEVPPYPVQNILVQPIRREAARQGNPDYVNLWAGQAAALTRYSAAADYLTELSVGARRHLGGRVTS